MIRIAMNKDGTAIKEPKAHTNGSAYGVRERILSKIFILIVLKIKSYGIIFIIASAQEIKSHSIKL